MNKQNIINIKQGPIKSLLITFDDVSIKGISLLFNDCQNTAGDVPKQLDDVVTQLLSYFEEAHSQWTIDITGQGTAFQQRVWRFLQSIPMGETRTYGQLAKQLNSSARAVGNACRANPFLLVVPCHRVVKQSGLGGFAGKVDGEAVEIKQWLLESRKESIYLALCRIIYSNFWIAYGSNLA